MKPYPEYKPTGLAWLPEIPKHWKLVRGKNLFKKANRPVEEGSEVITCFRDGEVTLRKNRRATGFTESLKEIGYQGIKKGDLVIHVMDAFAGAIGVSDSDGKGTPVYNVCIARAPDTTNNYYFAYIVRVMAQTGYIQSLYRGIRERSSDFRFEVFANQTLPFPPADEQAQIVRYLDAMTAKINKLIRAKKRQIALLQEQKQAIINQAVTRGLDPDVELKDSGQGGSNSGWIEKPLKYFVKSNLNSLSQTTNKNFQFHYLDISSVGFGYIKTQPESMFFADAPSRARRIVEYGDTIISTVRTYLRSMCFIDSSLKDCIVSTGFCVLHPSKDIIPEILWYFLSADSFVNLVIKNSIGISYPAIAESRLLSIKIQLPLCKNEQKKIIGFIESSTNKINQAQKALRNGIKILQEYKNTLIAAVVTGKVDVRNIAVEAVSPEDLAPSDDPDESEELDSPVSEESEE